VAGSILLAACAHAPLEATPEARPAPTPPAASSALPSPAPSTPPAPAAPAPPAAERTACTAPSLALARPADARDAAALETCAFEPSGHDDIADRCALTPHEVTLGRLDEAVLAFDEATLVNVRATFARGKELGRNPRAFGLVGDSMTASPKFLSPFAHESRSLPPEVAEAVAYFKSAPVHAGLDSFLAPRAAKIGAPSSWALPAGRAWQATPLGDMIRTTSPAIALVMYGSNDAAVRFVAIDELRQRFRARMERILDRLTAEGIVAVLHTVPRHMHDEARPDCGSAPGQVSNWRLAVQTSVVSAVAAELACERHLPLVDLRHGFDALLNHGIGPDGVHPNAHPESAGRLDAEGLRCGYNARNYLALRMLERLRQAIPLP
jgi:hypothetical protein